jgi:hypothetical protein
VPQEGYGDLVTRQDLQRFASAIRLKQGCNLNVPARMLLNGDFTFCPICDFNDLNGQRQHARQPLRGKLHDEHSVTCIERPGSRSFARRAEALLILSSR